MQPRTTRWLQPTNLDRKLHGQMPFEVANAIGTVRLDGTKYTQLHAKEDGNCLFHSVGYLLERMGKNEPVPTNHGTLRTLTCDRVNTILTTVDIDLEVQQSCKTHVYDALGVSEGDNEAKAAALTKYVKDMRDVDVAWGDLLCVYALELIYGVRIEVYHLNHASAVAKANFPANDAAGGVLRIVTPYTGRDGYYNHYNPLVVDPTPLESTPAAAVEAPEKAPKDPKQWSFWDPKGLFLYQPPSAHSMYTDLWTAPPVAQLRGRKLAVSNSSEHVIEDAKPRITNLSLDGGASNATSTSYKADVDQDTLDDAFDEPFILNLSRDESGRATAAIDPAEVIVSVDASLFESVVSLQFRVLTRERNEGGAEAVAVGELLRPELEKKAKGRSGVQSLSIPLSEVFAEEELAKLSYAGSPYRLDACPNGVPGGENVEADQWAFTYFHVPSPWDINTPEGVQSARIIPLEDDLSGLRKVKGVATVQSRNAKNDAAVKAPEGVRDEDVDGRNVPGDMSHFISSFRDPENPNYVPAQHNVFWQLEDDSYYVATSWASILVLVQDIDGDYVAHSLLLHGSSLKLYIATKEAQRAAGELGDERVTLLSKLKKELEAYRYKRRPYDGLSWITDRADRARLWPGVEAQQTKAQLASTAVQEHAQTWRYVQKQGAEKITNSGENVDVRIAEVSRIIPPLESVLKIEAEEVAKSAQRESIIRIAGESDFEGFRPGTKGGWDQYFLPPGMKINRAVTQGISSCAGGVTFANEEGNRPSAMILWHIDFPPWVPIKQIISQLWPEPKECPDLRTVAFVYPDCAELNKYRPAMIYPEAVRDRCDTVFMTRGDHLGVEDFSLGSGGEYFGLDLSNRKRADLVFTHDLNKRTEMVGKREAAHRDETKGDAEASITLSAFHKNVFGRYRFEGIPVKGHDRDAMRQYVTKVAKTDDDEVKNHKLGKCSVVRLAGIGPAMFDALHKASTPLLEAPCSMLGLRVEQEFGNATSEVQAERAWRTGHQDRPVKKKREEEPKKKEPESELSTQ